MATEPPEEEVQNLINIAGVTRHQAVTLLRASKVPFPHVSLG